jgi:hypothetical protein
MDSLHIYSQDLLNFGILLPEIGMGVSLNRQQLRHHRLEHWLQIDGNRLWLGKSNDDVDELDRAVYTSQSGRRGDARINEIKHDKSPFNPQQSTTSTFTAIARIEEVQGLSILSSESSDTKAESGRELRDPEHGRLNNVPCSTTGVESCRSSAADASRITSKWSIYRLVAWGRLLTRPVVSERPWPH